MRMWTKQHRRNGKTSDKILSVAEPCLCLMQNDVEVSETSTVQGLLMVYWKLRRKVGPAYRSGLNPTDCLVAFSSEPKGRGGNTSCRGGYAR